VVEDVDDRDVGVNLDGLAVQVSGPIAPLVDRFEGGIVEQRIAGEDLERFDGTVGGDDGMEFDASFVMKSDGESRVDRFGASD